ncbi:MAG: PAS domain S-box protein [Ignavibacteriales bacterium]
MPQDFMPSSPENLLQLVGKAPIGILLFSADWKIIFANDNFFQFGVIQRSNTEDLTGVDLLESSIPQMLKIETQIRELKEGSVFEREINNTRTINGGEISIVAKGTPVFRNGQFSGGILILEDLKVVPSVKHDAQFNAHLIGALAEEFGDILLIAGNDLRISYFFLSKLGNTLFPSRDLLNKHLEEILLPFLKLETAIILGNLLRERQNIERKISYRLGDRTIILRVSFVVPDGESAPSVVFVLLKDITKEENEEVIRSNELAELKQYEYITSAVTDAVIATDMEGGITFWNKSAERLFRYSRSMVFGKFIGKLIPDFDKSFFETLKEELRGNITRESEIRLNGSRNEEEYISVKACIADEENFHAIIFLCSSITERIRVEKELRISEERFRNIVIHANEFICNLDLNGNITYINPRFIKSFDYSEGELLQKNIRDLIDPEYLAATGSNLENLFDTSTGPAELCLITRSGKKLFILANLSPIVDLDNTVKYYNGIFTDITEKKEAEKEMSMIRSVYEASRDGISVEVNRKFILVNESFAEMFGFSSTQELIGRDSLDIISNEDIPMVARFIKARENRESAPSHYEFLGKRIDNSLIYVEASVTSYEADNNIYIVSVCRDITERKRTQEALKDSEEKYRNITENIDDFLWTAERINNRLKPVFYTSTIEKMTGYPQDQFISDSKLWFKLIYPGDLEAVTKKLKNLLNDPARFSDGIEFRIINRAGNIVWVRNKITVKRDNQGLPVKIYGLVSDISLSKKAAEDLRKLTDDLRELNDTKDKFLSIISHDLRTPFSSIMGFTDILLSEKDIPEKQRNQYIGFIQESSRNMLSLVNSLLDWTRLQTGRIKFEPERINAREVIDKTVTIMMGTALQKNIELKSLLNQDVFVHADSNLLLQVINNLVSNSIKFTRSGGCVSITAMPSETLDQFQFTIKDTGVGIKKENLDKLFKVDSKFTLEGTGGEKGSGLGLSIVREIIEKHGGTIWVNSEFGAGSEFHFTLPVAAANILLVDDSRTDRLLYSKILKNIVPHYRIDEANNGKEAMDIITTHTPALIISDHNMPEMSGYDMVKQLRTADIKGKPPVIILSGDLNKHIIEEYRELEVEYVFQKPVNLSNFKTAIDKSLRKALFS